MGRVRSAPPAATRGVADAGTQHSSFQEPTRADDRPTTDDVETTEGYYHVRFRDPDGFDDIRTPDWAAKPAESVVEGAEVRTGHRTDGDWEIQNVLVPVDAVADEEEALDRAMAIVEKIESRPARHPPRSVTDRRAGPSRVAIPSCTRCRFTVADGPTDGGDSK